MGLSQVELAERAKSQDTYIGEIERGNRNISLKMLVKIVDTLEVSVTTFLRKLKACSNSSSISKL